MHLAKLEISSLLKATIAQVDKIVITRAPDYKANNVLRLLDTFPLEFRAAA
jgi:hypothetical protein